MLAEVSISCFKYRVAIFLFIVECLIVVDLFIFYESFFFLLSVTQGILFSRICCLVDKGIDCVPDLYLPYPGVGQLLWGKFGLL